MARHLNSNGTGQAPATVGGPSIEPLTVRIGDAVRLTGISRSTLYELIRAGRVETVKVGRSTLVRYASLKKLAGL